MRVGFIGPMMSGKTTVARVLAERYGYAIIALADAVKDDCVWMLNAVMDDIRFTTPNVMPQYSTDMPYINRVDIDKNKHIYRPLLQWYGTNFWRQYQNRDTFWLERLHEAVVYTESSTPGIGIATDDVRFVNEGQYLRQNMGYVLIRVERPEDERMTLLRQTYPDPSVLANVLSHLSETDHALIEADFTFYNNKRLEDIPFLVNDCLIPYLQEKA